MSSRSDSIVGFLGYFAAGFISIALIGAVVVSGNSKPNWDGVNLLFIAGVIFGLIALGTYMAGKMHHSLWLWWNAREGEPETPAQDDP